MTNKEKIEFLLENGYTLQKIAKKIKLTTNYVRWVYQEHKMRDGTIIKGGQHMSDQLDDLIKTVE